MGSPTGLCIYSIQKISETKWSVNIIIRQLPYMLILRVFVYACLCLFLPVSMSVSICLGICYSVLCLSVSPSLCVFVYFSMTFCVCLFICTYRIYPIRIYYNYTTLILLSVCCVMVVWPACITCHEKQYIELT